MFEQTMFSYLDRDVLDPVGDDDPDWRSDLVRVHEALLHRAQRVLHELEHHQMQVRGDVPAFGTTHKNERMNHVYIVIFTVSHYYITNVNSHVHVFTCVNRRKYHTILNE